MLNRGGKKKKRTNRLGSAEEVPLFMILSKLFES